MGVDTDLKANLAPEKKIFRIAEQMGWVYRVYQQKASLSIKKRIFQMGEYISGFPADFWVSYLGDPFRPSSPELTRYIEDFQTWVPADGASIGLEATSLHGVITLCIKNKVPRPGFAEALRAAFEAEGIRVLEACLLYTSHHPRQRRERQPRRAGKEAGPLPGRHRVHREGEGPENLCRRLLP